MAIITISSGFYSGGGEIAEKVAQRLGYRVLSGGVILEAAQKYQIAPYKLNKAIHDAPSIFERFFSEKQKYLAYMTAVILGQLRTDNVVYEGLAGHFFTSSITPMTAKILGEYCCS